MYTLVQDYELVTKSQFTKHTETWNTTTKSQSPSNKSLLEPPPLKPNPSGASLARDGKGKGVASESHKMHSRVQCFKCQGFGHNASSVNVLVMLPLTVPTRPLSDRKEYGSEEEGIEKWSEPNPDEFEVLDDDCLGNPNYLGCIRAI